MDLKNELLEKVNNISYRPLRIDELEAAMNITAETREKFFIAVDDLIGSGLIFKSKKNRLGRPDKMGVTPCVLNLTKQGYGFAVPITKTKESSEIYISADNINGAMHKDQVMVRILYESTGDGKASGEIADVFKRTNETIVGTYKECGGYGYVIPDNQKINMSVIIPAKNKNGAKDKNKIVAKIFEWPKGKQDAKAEVAEILGRSDDPGVDILSIIKDHNIETDFPQNILDEAEKLDRCIDADEIRRRMDYRDLETITIDGEDAKDLDDAVSIRKTGNGSFELYVHIADVSHYVREGADLDMEARRRGTSVYMADRTLPMFPPRLSNDICSLNPGEDRLTYTCRMVIDRSGEVIDHIFTESVININRRFSYTEVYEFLQDTENAADPEIGSFAGMFYDMRELALILEDKRKKRGSIGFNFDESKVVLDNDGRPIDIVRKKRTIAESIIEEFMIAANETVAGNFCNADIPFIYRIHEIPDKDKLLELNLFLLTFGYRIRNINACRPSDINEILKRAKGRKEEYVINTVVLRSLQKARYSDKNAGHFGLASSAYSHFTSPIRRYPDLYIHRIMKLFLTGKLRDEVLDFYNSQTSAVAENSSVMEMKADEAERESVELKKVEYMQRHIGEVFEGTISSIQRYGIFVELENTVEGLVKTADMLDDNYIYDEKTLSLKGEYSSVVFRIGDTVTVKLVNASMERRQIDFIIESDIGSMKNKRYSTYRGKRRNSQNK